VVVGTQEAADVTKQERFAEAYKMLAAPGYRPAAPSDGHGNITAPAEELDLDAEARDYARRFDAMDESMDWVIGCTDYTFNRAFVLALEACRLMCAGTGPGPDLVPTLLRKAAQEYERAWRDEAPR
jgi:hypothetical protein